jgi:predicted metal-dependent hydrolase
MRDIDVSTVEGSYQHGLELARAGRYFDAHEAFETAWRACDEHERDFFQGLVHVVVSAYQRERGRPVAAESQRVKALRRLAPYEPSHRGVDIAALRAALDRSEPDPREHLVDRGTQPPVTIEEEEQTEPDERRS